MIIIVHLYFFSIANLVLAVITYCTSILFSNPTFLLQTRMYSSLLSLLHEEERPRVEAMYG